MYVCNAYQCTVEDPLRAPCTVPTARETCRNTSLYIVVVADTRIHRFNPIKPGLDFRVR